MDNFPSENQVEKENNLDRLEKGWQLLRKFEVESKLGNERRVVNQVVEAIQDLQFPPKSLEKLKTAVAETTMNAMEYGNGYRTDLPVIVEINQSPTKIAVRITDFGIHKPIPEPEQPDLELKLKGLQTPRGWGLLIIKNMVDEMRVVNSEGRHTVELYFLIKENDDGI